MSGENDKDDYYNFREMAYGRLADAGVVEPETGMNCNVCRKNNIKILSIDTSGGEYGYINLCKSCIDCMFEESIDIVELHQKINPNKN